MAGAAPATSSSRYDTILKLASGGMATVWVGTVRGALGFRQLVAIKKPHPHLLGDPSFRSEIIAEARLASMIHHANVVDVRDVELRRPHWERLGGGELYAPLSRLDWATLLKRTFAIDLLCLRCGGRLGATPGSRARRTRGWSRSRFPRAVNRHPRWRSCESPTSTPARR